MSPRLLRPAWIPLALGLLAACANAPTSTDLELAPGVATTLRQGDRARLPDRSHLTYVGVRSDSRCPPDVTCIHAGWAELDFAHHPVADAARPMVLSTRAGAPAVRVGSWHLELVSVGRGASPLAQVRASAHGN